jgi:hypothetical protein
MESLCQGRAVYTRYMQEQKDSQRPFTADKQTFHTELHRTSHNFLLHELLSICCRRALCLGMAVVPSAAAPLG